MLVVHFPLLEQPVTSPYRVALRQWSLCLVICSMSNRVRMRSSPGQHRIRECSLRFADVGLTSVRSTSMQASPVYHTYSIPQPFIPSVIAQDFCDLAVSTGISDLRQLQELIVHSQFSTPELRRRGVSMHIVQIVERHLPQLNNALYRQYTINGPVGAIGPRGNQTVVSNVLIRFSTLASERRLDEFAAAARNERQWEQFQACSGAAQVSA